VAAPRDMVSAAEAMLASGVAGAEAWVRDQHDAAAAELRPLILGIATEMNSKPFETGGTVKSVAFGMSVVMSMIRRGKPEYRCPHSHTRTPPPLIADLGNGMIACLLCAKHYDLSPDEDGKCDLCGAPSVMFREFWLQLGPVLVHGDLCADCEPWLEPT
jgi:hypothetical protein